MSVENAAMAQWLREVAADENTPPHAIRGMRVAYDRAMRRPRAKLSEEAIIAVLTERKSMTTRQFEVHFSATNGIVCKWLRRMAAADNKRVRVARWERVSPRSAPSAFWELGSDPDAARYPKAEPAAAPIVVPPTSHALHPMGMWGALAQP